MESPRKHTRERFSVCHELRECSSAYKCNRSVSQELASCNIMLGKTWPRVRPQYSNRRQIDIEVDQIFSDSTCNHNKRKTKIICAIGPSSCSEEMIGRLLDEGMSVTRLNFSHGDHALHEHTLQNLRAAVRKRPGCHCAVLLDTKGPEIRTGLLENGIPVQLLAGQQLEITCDSSVKGTSDRIPCNYPHLPASVKPGSKILCDDGNVAMIVQECRSDSVIVKVLNSHMLEERKNMCFPGAAIRISGITQKDKHDLLQFALPQAVDIVSGSFVRTANNVRAIRDCLGDKGKHIRIHAKIESVEALRNIDEILKVADGVHVSRGDLGMELAPQQVALAQKMIIRKANFAGKPVVTSTQMLQSMTKCSTPSYAECTDVANAILDGTDAMMLSAETATGKYPCEAVQMMAKICVEAELTLAYEDIYRCMRAITPRPFSLCESIASTAVQIAIDVQASLIISLTDTGHSTKLLAKYRPRARILAVTASASTSRQLSGVSRGVSAIRVQSMIGADKLTLKAINYAKEQMWIQIGDIVVMIHGVQDAVSGATNIVKVIQADATGFRDSTNFLFKKLQVPSSRN